MDDGGGGYGGSGNQGYGQQHQQQASYGQSNQGYGNNMMGGNQQQQMGGGMGGMYGSGAQQQRGGIPQVDSVGPFADIDMQFGGTMQDPLGSMDAQQQHQQQQHQQQQPQQSFASGQSDPQADMWQQAFFKLAAAAGVPVNPSQGQSPDTIIEKAQAARQRDPWVQAQARDAAMQVQAAVLTAQNIHLRRELGSGWAAADTNIIQVQQLMLDPAIEHEFQQLRTQLQMRVQETEAAKAAYEGQAFTPESKSGHALLRKVKVLTEENEDLGRQQRETKQAAQGAIAAVERRHADELREELQDTRDLCTFYQQENEELNMVSMLYQRQLEHIKQQMAAQPAPVPDRDLGRDRVAGGSRDARPFDRSGDRDRPLPPRDRTPADRDRDRTAERPRDRTAERSREGDRPGDRPPAPRERESYDIDRTAGHGRGGYSGSRFDTGRGSYRGRGRGRNISQQYTGAGGKRAR